MTRRDHNLASTPKAISFGASRAPYLERDWEGWALLPGRPGLKMVGRWLGGGRWCGLKASGLLRQGLAATLDLEDDGDWLTQAEVDEWPTSTVCVLGRRYPAIDVDCDDEAVCSHLLAALAPTAKRGRTGSPRFLVPFLAAGPIQGWRPILFTLPGSTTPHAIEWNGDGKQWLASGKHPKGGEYGWRGEKGALLPLPPSVSSLPVITADDASRIRAELVEVLRGLGALFLKGSDQEVRQGVVGEDRDPMELPALVTEEQLALILQHVECSPAVIGGHIDFIAFIASMRAARGCDGELMPECVLDWAAGYPGADNGAAWAEKVWNSYGTVRSGKGPLMQMAQKHMPEEEYQRIQQRVDLAEVRGVFDVVEGDMGTPPAGVGLRKDAEGRPDTALELCRRAFVYREPTGEWVRTRDGAIMKREVFNDTTEARDAAEEDFFTRRAAAAPGEKVRPMRPHELMMQRGCVRVQAITYRPGKGKLFRDGGVETFNRYTAPERPFQGQTITERQVRPFLDLVQWVFPEPVEQELFLDWLSFIAQNPGEKVQWAPVLFSREHGVGKDLLLAVLEGVVGEGNFTSIKPARLEGDFNDDWAPSQVVYVTELPSSRKRDLADTLKSLVASHAGRLSVNPKGLARYWIPNDHCWVFTTNKEDALALDVEDRRYAILHAREAKLQDGLKLATLAFYDLKGGRAGLHLAGEWLRRRTISTAFSSHKCPPPSAAKQNMTIETLSPQAGLLHEHLTEGDWRERRTILSQELEPYIDNGARRGDLAKALQLAGFRFPNSSDGRGRVTIGGGKKARKLKIWTRDLEAPAGEAAPVRPVPISVRSGPAIVEVLSTEISEHNNKVAGLVDDLMRDVKPRSV